MILKSLSSEQESNIPLQLIESIRNDSVFCFFGTGLSIPLGLPSWNTLVEEIFKGVSSSAWSSNFKDKEWLKEKCSSMPDWAAEVLKSENPQQFRATLKDVFRNTNFDIFSLNHCLLSLIPFKAYLTTNYDTVLEHYFSFFNHKKPLTYDQDEAISNFSDFLNMKRYLLKIHGCIEKNTENLIISSLDYYTLITDQRYIRLMSWIFSQHTILVCGMSLRDRDLRHFIEERYHLYQKKCPEMYVIVSEKETCPLEIKNYHNRYNVQIIPISPNNNYEQLTSILFSIFCLVYRADSVSNKKGILSLIDKKCNVQDRKTIVNAKFKKDLALVEQIISTFKEPIDFDAFTTICTNNNISLGPVHYRIIGKLYGTDKINNTKLTQPTHDSREIVAKWVNEILISIPIDATPRYLSFYYKKIITKYVKTIASLLEHREGWDILIRNNEENLVKINEYFRQEGLWTEWLNLSKIGIKYFAETDSIYILILRTQLWVYFWTRQYSEAKTIVSKYPKVDNKKGETSYKSRLKYMEVSENKKLIENLSKQTKLDYFNQSLLGRAYARLAIREANVSKKEDFLCNAKKFIELALKGAKRKNDLIEIAVQSWYLSLVCLDLNENAKAFSYISEVRRLDESIMNRKPGIAWLSVAEYRLSLKTGNPEEIAEKKAIAIDSMASLGTIDPENYIENDYFY